jgi:quercetin dioxygenase-like cupin family protein
MAATYFFTPNLNDQISEIPPDSIVSRTYLQDANIKAILFGFAIGQELSEHTASIPAIIHVLEGEATLTIGADSFEVKSGAWAYLPPKLSHSIRAKTPIKMLLIMLPNHV